MTVTSSNASAWQITQPKRAVAEGFLLFGFFTWLLFRGDLQPILFLQGVDFSILPGVGLYIAFRLRPLQGPHPLGKELGLAACLVLGLFFFRMLLNSWTFGGGISTFPNGPSFELYKSLIFTLFPYPALRSCHLIMAHWLPQKRERLRWMIASDAAFIVFFLSLGIILVWAIFQARDPNLSKWIQPHHTAYAAFIHRLVLGFLSHFMVGLLLATLTLPFLLGIIGVIANVTARHIDARLRLLTDWFENPNPSPKSPLREDVGEFHHLKTSLQTLVSRWKNHEKALQDQKHQLDQMLDSQRQWVAMVSHDLRTPLTVAKNQLDQARSNPSAADLQNAWFEQLSNQMDHLQILVEDLFASVQAGVPGPKLNPALLDVDAFLQQLSESWALVAWRKHKITLRYLPFSPSSLFQVDSQRLRQVLGNLIHNALQHTSPGGLVMLGLGEQETYFTISVSDTGCGIPQEDRLHIWEAHTTSSQGDPMRAGLGLAIVKNLVTAMGGYIALNSEPGNGSSFTMTLPKQVETLPRHLNDIYATKEY